MLDRKRNRLSVFDYSKAGYYFITLCVHSGLPLFGNLKNKSIILSDIGSIVKKHLEIIPSIHPNVSLDEYIIMPDHLHAILVIENDFSVGDANLASLLPSSSNLASPKQTSTNPTSSKFPQEPNMTRGNGLSDPKSTIFPQEISASLPEGDRTKMLLCIIIQQFKRVCTMEIKQRKLFKDNIWQRSFYDRVLRNESELILTRKYIKDNPVKWQTRKIITR
jgi:REP element-mobilizing transposase RayT